MGRRAASCRAACRDAFEGSCYGHPMHSRNRASVVTSLVVVVLAACGLGDSDLPIESEGDGGTSEGGRDLEDSSLQDSRVPIVDGPDEPPVSFPQALPRLFGYDLRDAFPGTFLSGAMDMQWPVGAKDPFVLQRGGHIVQLHGGGTRTLVLNFEGEVAMRGEGGALGMALHPKFSDPTTPKPYVYVWYNAEGTPTRQRLSRWTWNSTTKLFDPTSEFVLIEQKESVTEHNGGRVRFGPDGFLYFGNGDDTRPEQTTQRLDGGLFSGIFRIDVDQAGGSVSHSPLRQPLDAVTKGYFIPNSNPFVGVSNANEEYFALGVRNPYGLTFDRKLGTLWLGDVGESFREEVNLVTAGSNYGWPFSEGTRKRQPGTPSIGTLKAPAYEYRHASIADLVATMTGYIYRGKELPDLVGKLVFSDWPTGRVWALDTSAAKRVSLYESNLGDSPVGFGQDADGELYVIAWSKILKLVKAPPHGVPKKLSETKIFRNLQSLKVPSALHAYTIRSPLWSDGATKQRYVYVPTGVTAKMQGDGTVTLPPGSLLVKQFDLPAEANPKQRGKRLETRVLVIGTESTYGVTYRWNAAGTDADLVIEAAEERIADTDPKEDRTWHFPSFGECWSCHRAENRVLGFRGEQLNFTTDGGTNQLSELASGGVFDTTSIASAPAPLASPSDPSASVEARATAVLAANCWSCHHPGASYLGGEETWNAAPGVLLENRGLVNKPHHNRPVAEALGIPNAPLISPGNPANSVLLQRMKHTADPDLRMPPVLRSRVDAIGVAAVEAWIHSIP